MFLIGGSSTTPNGIWEWEKPGKVTCHARSVLSSTNYQAIDLENIRSFISVPMPVAFPGIHGECYAYYYPPNNLCSELGDEFKPPLLVRAHGGPTAQASRTFRLDNQFWTSRGFAVLDVDYGGSTGYGR